MGGSKNYAYACFTSNQCHYESHFQRDKLRKESYVEFSKDCFGEKHLAMTIFNTKRKLVSVLCVYK